ncbi:RNA polymerase sigma factor SigI [Mycolicibacterium wolinskyi]|uniref:RNA polymerase subunit sigma n=1 Tax=Mycolicibacterium wolinskyi TaxID=59750 RepID=A0A1X2EWH5_9MYCO|nr:MULTISPECIES: RNA polymerase sigma factor SigI [Mycolicibacterium]MCV7286234.1 RNA polymerase sigma factor SigI [Mycolicibacterium wolinskyi]MCV7293214.1 RNA polymerase sigma factor SigI [Mycolicibacterium goodii]ORX10542.1 RNA polymerase subunit sigma [Mycolicibacterium wolinskyi]
MTDSALVEQAWRDHRPYLVNLAYQMLGDIGEAEDAAQEAFLRLSRAEEQHIDDVRAWLTVVTGRLCLDRVRSARARLERPDAGEAVQTTPAADPDPADRVTLDDQVRTALLTVLDRLSPAERVAFVLHDVFGVPFDEIAVSVGRPVGTCRQLARRARLKFAETTPRPAQIEATEHQLVVEKFITACANGDLQALTEVLDPTVWGVATFVGDPAPPPQINHGRDRVAPNLLHHLAGGTLVGGAVGEPGVLAFLDRRLVAVLVFTVRGGRIAKIEATVDPSARTR